MRLLVLGGTAFLSRAVAAEGVRRGHEVTAACRGTGALPEGVRHLPLDRSSQGLADLGIEEGAYDAVVDVARTPSWVRSATQFSASVLPEAHWVFVSTISVYADDSIENGGPETVPVVAAIDEDVDLTAAPEAYGGMKVACERTVLDRVASATIARPGLIVGPEDPSGRFTYWPVRIAEGGRVVAPGRPDDPVQVIDARDLAGWLVHCAEERVPGVLDAVGSATGWGAFLDEIAAGVCAEPHFVWAPSERLLALGIEPWAGPDSLPVWLPPEHAGTVTHDWQPARSAGLVTRPLSETARDTLAWVRRTPDARVSGISREKESSLLERLLG